MYTRSYVRAPPPSRTTTDALEEHHGLGIVDVVSFPSLCLLRKIKNKGWVVISPVEHTHTTICEDFGSSPQSQLAGTDTCAAGVSALSPAPTFLILFQKKKSLQIVKSGAGETA